MDANTVSALATAAAALIAAAAPDGLDLFKPDSKDDGPERVRLRKRHRRVAFCLFVVLLSASGLLWYFKPWGKPDPPQRPIHYTVLPDAVPDRPRREFVLSGSIFPDDLQGKELWLLSRTADSADYFPNTEACSTSGTTFSCSVHLVDEVAKAKGMRLTLILVDAAKGQSLVGARLESIPDGAVPIWP